MSDASPAWHTIVQPLIAQARDNKITITQIHEYAQSLSSDHKATLDNSPLPDPATLDPAAVKAYQDKVKADLLSPEALEQFKQAARDAVTACKGIDTMFMSLETLLAKIDNDNGLTGTDMFLPTFSNIQNAWRQILSDSRTLAAAVAVSAKSFDQTIMPVVANPDVPKDTKLAIIEADRQGTKHYETASAEIKKRLDTMVDDFEKFVGTFGDWGKARVGTLNDQIEQAKTELHDLLDKAEKLRKTMIGFGVATGIGILSIVGGFFAGPWAPIFWVAGGLVTLGFGTGLVAMGISYKNCMDDIDAKRAQIEDLKKVVSDIEAARTQLQNAGKADVKYIQDHIGAMTGIWTTLNTDLEEVADWIEKGENLQNQDKIPAILKMNLIGTQLADASAIYSRVADYLTEYSSGMLTSGIPNPT